MVEDFLNALSTFKHAKVRTFLSLLGVIIGVTSVIVIMSLGASSTEKIKVALGSTGLDFLTLQTGFAMRRYGNSRNIQFDSDFQEKLFDSVAGIKKIWSKYSTNATISYGETSVNASCLAIESGYLEQYGLTIDYGSFFLISDNVIGAQKVVLGSETASTLFPSGNAVGAMISLIISNTHFTFEVVGVLKQSSSGMENSTNAAYVPLAFYTKHISPNALPSILMVQTETSAIASSVAENIKTYCTEISGQENMVNVSSMQTYMEQVSEVTGLISTMLAAIAAISLVVGGIGIMNIMIITVTERRQEIGIRKALGATNASIRQQFLVESASITLIGGVIGIIVGCILSLAIEYVQSNILTISLPACVISFFFSVFVGIFFGLHPASRAAKLNPIEALAI